VTRLAWLQKHPTPAASGGEFHWFPAEGDRELRAACVERMRGIDPPAVLWELGPGRVAWARVFAAIAPGDGRRYAGLALAIVERDGAIPAELLVELAVPPPHPMPQSGPPATRPTTETGAWSIAEATAVARTLLRGGAAHIGDLDASDLAARVASLEGWLPDDVSARARRGCWLPGAPSGGEDDPAAALVQAAWRAPASRSARAWRLARELARARSESIDVVLAATHAAAARVLTDEERAAAPAMRELVDVLHAWGRGRFDGCTTSSSSMTRLADAVALAALGELAADRDPGAVLARARWHALLPADRRAALFTTLARRAPALGDAPEAAP
jgi:hypothetical protein